MRKNEELWTRCGLLKKYERRGVALYQNARTWNGMPDRFVITIEECYLNVRNDADVMAWAEEAMLFAQPTHSGVTEDNYIIFLYVSHPQHVHHFKNKRIICISRDRIYTHAVDSKMRIFIDAMIYKYQLTEVHREHHMRRTPESMRYSYWVLPILIAVTVACYVMSRLTGVTWGYSVTENIAGNWQNMFLYMFAHGSIRHLVGNMVALWFIGKTVMQVIGPVRTLTTYFITGVLAAFMDSLLMARGIYGTVDTITVGASSAIFGLMGVLLIEMFHDRTLELKRGRFITYICLCIINSFSPGVSWSGHLLGLGIGMFFGILWAFTMENANYRKFNDAQERIFRYRELLKRCAIAIMEGKDTYDKDVSGIERKSRFETGRLDARLSYVDSGNWVLEGRPYTPPSYARTGVYRDYIERGKY